jgi:plastocyanin
MATATEQQTITRTTKSRRAPLTYDQFLLGQVPLLIAVGLIFGVIAYAARDYMPTGGGGAATASGGETGQATGAASNGAITAFSGDTVAQQVPVATDPSGALKWDRATYTAKAGDVTFVVTNAGSGFHNFAVEGPNVMAQSKNFGGNSTNTFTLKGLPPGEYLIVCNYPGHRAAGMVSKLIVT